MGIASLVLGIVGLVFSCIPCLVLWSLLLTIPGLILGIVGMSQAKKTGKGKGPAIGGLICSIIGLAIAAFWLILGGAIAAAAS
ncbi:MAG: DUF4190 domain-containing protein [Kiritimatiellae bacterium]|nr:DUF4190 domain-containing protein [Kiritimatiellia bacterium]